MPGVGTRDPRRKIAIIASVNNSFLRRSGVLNARPKAVSTGSSWRPRKTTWCWQRSIRGTITPRGRESRRPGRCRGVALRSENGGGAAGCLDLVLGRGRELVRGHGHRDGDLAGAEHLDQLAVTHGTLGHEGLDGDVATLGEQRRDAVEVHDLVLGAERVLEAAKLRHPHVHRHLTALKALGHLVTGTRALGATTGGLALASLATTHAGLGGLGTRRGPKVVHLQRGGVLLRGLSHDQSTSSTATRWSTVRTIPRISGRSSLTTTSPMRFRPRERRVSRWFCFPPISERVWVTLSRAITRPSPRHGRAAARPGQRPRG